MQVGTPVTATPLTIMVACSVLPGTRVATALAPLAPVKVIWPAVHLPAESLVSGTFVATP